VIQTVWELGQTVWTQSQTVWESGPNSLGVVWQ
jgi:hypothetical protein